MAVSTVCVPRCTYGFVQCDGLTYTLVPNKRTSLARSQPVTRTFRIDPTFGLACVVLFGVIDKSDGGRRAKQTSPEAVSELGQLNLLGVEEGGSAGFC